MLDDMVDPVDNHIGVKPFGLEVRAADVLLRCNYEFLLSIQNTLSKAFKLI